MINEPSGPKQRQHRLVNSCGGGSMGARDVDGGKSNREEEGVREGKIICTYLNGTLF